MMLSLNAAYEYSRYCTSLIDDSKELRIFKFEHPVESSMNRNRHRHYTRVYSTTNEVQPALYYLTTCCARGLVQVLLTHE